MNRFTSVRKIVLGLYSSIRRFPVTLLFSSSVAILLMIIIELSPSINPNTQEFLIRIAMVLALGIPLSLCAKVYYERKLGEGFSRLLLYYVFVIIIQILYFFLLLNNLNMVSITRFIGINIVFYLCFLCIPFFPHRKNFVVYVIHLVMRFLITYVYSVILFLGLAAILFTIHHLLGIQVKGQIYYDTFLMVSLIFAPAYFLAYVPRKDEDLLGWNYSKILKILLLYIVMPLLSIYTLILYIYFGKILISMQWPQGLVSHLVLWYGIILTGVLFLIHPVKEESSWAFRFSTWAPPIVLPLILMMFVSMGIRINAYGMTENRYYVLALGLWIFATMIYLSIRKKRKFIYLPISLSIIILLSVLGPINSYNLSKHSQNSRLERILEENNMIKEGEIQSTQQNVSKKDKQSISSILEYFNRNHNFKEVNVLPENFEMSKMEEVLGFPYVDPYMHSSHYFYYTINRDPDILDISEYDFLYRSDGMYKKIQEKDNSFTAELIPNINTIIIKYNQEEILKKDLSDFVEQLSKKYGVSQRAMDISPEDMTLIEETDAYKFKFMIKNIGGEGLEGEKLKINEMYFDLLIKAK